MTQWQYEVLVDKGILQSNLPGPLPTRRRYDPIHSEVHDELAVVIRRMPDRKRREPQACGLAAVRPPRRLERVG